MPRPRLKHEWRFDTAMISPRPPAGHEGYGRRKGIDDDSTRVDDSVEVDSATLTAVPSDDDGFVDNCETGRRLPSRCGSS